MGAGVQHALADPSKGQQAGAALTAQGSDRHAQERGGFGFGQQFFGARQVHPPASCLARGAKSYLLPG